MILLSIVNKKNSKSYVIYERARAQVGTRWNGGARKRGRTRKREPGAANARARMRGMWAGEHGCANIAPEQRCAQRKVGGRRNPARANPVPGTHAAARGCVGKTRGLRERYRGAKGSASKGHENIDPEGGWAGGRSRIRGAVEGSEGVERALLMPWAVMLFDLSAKTISCVGS
jgi:hypothetical protein